MLVEGGGGHSYATLLDDVHLHPVRARLVKVRAGQSAGGSEWSSLPGGYLAPLHRRAPWLGASGGEDTAGGTEGFSAPAGTA